MPGVVEWLILGVVAVVLALVLRWAIRFICHAGGNRASLPELSGH